MRSESISVTEAARNFADCINRVRYQGAQFVLEKNGVAVARIVPVEEVKQKEKEGLAEREATAERAESAAKQARREREIW
jgi:prevent-host-death family protein